ncbi:bifunctional folylpolyglutamate synthase/dihydrofolate synthase [Eubacteriales bacterium KG127]
MTVKSAKEKLKEFHKFGSVLGLDRMKTLLNELGNPEKELKVIHVAGTNGKGSICHYIYGGLINNGYRTGMFISPFLENFNERIQLDGHQISDEDLELFTDKVLEAVNKIVDKALDSPTEFEVITAIAILYFKEKKADVVILEVGLGGRGDSTNVIDKPIMTIIGSISYDHMDRLGDTIEEIAREKAGIVKQNCPLITAIDNFQAFKVVEAIAKDLNSRLFNVYNLMGRIKVNRETITGISYEIRLGNERYNVETSMGGSFQITNSLAALMALEYLRKEKILSLDIEKILLGINMAFNPGRLEIISEMPSVILDGAHNIESARCLRVSLEKAGNSKARIVLLGMMADKDMDGIIKNLKSLGEIYFVTEPKIDRRAEGEQIKKILEYNGVDETQIRIIKSPEEAVRVAFKEIRAKKSSGLLVAGSLYLIGEVRRVVIEEVKKGVM